MRYSPNFISRSQSIFYFHCTIRISRTTSKLNSLLFHPRDSSHCIHPSYKHSASLAFHFHRHVIVYTTAALHRTTSFHTMESRAPPIVKYPTKRFFSAHHIMTSPPSSFHHQHFHPSVHDSLSSPHLFSYTHRYPACATTKRY